MLVALPLFVFTITNLNLNPQKKAASGEVPSPTPIPTPGPTDDDVVPTPTPTPGNQAPKITTGSLPNGKLGKKYSASVRGVDVDKGDTLTMNARNLPNGLEFGNCKTASLSITCKITGTPKKIRTYHVDVSLRDSAGNKTTKTFKVVIK